MTDKFLERSLQLADGLCEGRNADVLPIASIDAPVKLLDLIQSHRVTAVIYVAARLGLAELLRDGAQTVDELAHATRADRDALARLLVALSTVGICSRVGEHHYSLTELGAGLDGTAEQSFKNWAVFEGHMLTKRWDGLLNSIMSGKTAAQLQNVDDNFDLMARTPEHVRMFNDAMADLTRLVTPDVLQAYDFSAVSHLMDVGAAPASSSVPWQNSMTTSEERFSTFRDAPTPRTNISGAWESPTASPLLQVISSSRSLRWPMLSS